MSTIKDVAREAGVSVATVSYVVNGTKKVSAEVEARVLEAAHKLNYRPNAAARSLRKSEARILGYELPLPETGDISSFMQRFAYGLTTHAAEAGYHIISFAAVGEDIVQTYRQMILAGRVDGFIVAGTNWHDDRIQFLMKQGFPFVSFGRTAIEKPYSYVDVDGYDGLQQVVNHLVELGHENIAFIGWPKDSFSGDNREQGYLDALDAAGVAAPAIERSSNTIEGGYAAARKLITNHPDITAIACVSDVIAIGAVRYLSRHGYHVGQDIAVTGFDDIPLAQYVTPPLTTVTQPLDEVVFQLIDVLTHKIEEDPSYASQTLLKPTLVIRDSTIGVTDS